MTSVSADDSYMTCPGCGTTFEPDVWFDEERYYCSPPCLRSAIERRKQPLMLRFAGQR